ncbi:MAG: ester cyclase [Terracidiphilus sp.]|nr:ester cyclase [Terracidiphilus sp.]
MKTAVAFVLLMCAPALAAVASTPAPSIPVAVSQQEMNKAIARRVFEEIFNQGNFQVADRIYARDFVNHGLHRNASLQDDQAAARWEKQAFPDLKMTVDLMVAEGDLVTAVWTMRGTNTAAASPLPATGVKLELRGITVWRIVDGKIREEWTSFDTLRAVRQFADQLKWQLIGLLCATLILLWMLGRGIQKLLLNCWATKG